MLGKIRFSEGNIEHHIFQNTQSMKESICFA
jgi:hypothetical protein